MSQFDLEQQLNVEEHEFRPQNFVGILVQIVLRSVLDCVLQLGDVVLGSVDVVLAEVAQKNQVVYYVFGEEGQEVVFQLLQKGGEVQSELEVALVYVVEHALLHSFNDVLELFLLGEVLLVFHQEVQGFLQKPLFYLLTNVLHFVVDFPN